MNKPSALAHPKLIAILCRLAKVFPAPVNVANAPVDVPVVESVPLLPEGADEPVLPPEEAVELEPSLLPPITPTDGEMLSGAWPASSVKVVIVRDLFCAGLKRMNVNLCSLSLLISAWRYSRVDHTNHSRLAMFPLRTIIPDGLGVVD